MRMMTRLRRRSFRLPREWSNMVLRRLATEIEGAVVNVSGWDDRDKTGSTYRQYFTGADSYSITNFRGERGLDESKQLTDFELDLREPLRTDLEQRFDAVFNHTTLEHIFDVHTAFANLCRLSRDLVIVVVPFAQEVHFTSAYGDYWRFTPMGLRELFRMNGLEVVFESSSPHSDAGVYLLFVGARRADRWRDRWPEWQPVNELGRWIGRQNPLLRLGRFLSRRR